MGVVRYVGPLIVVIAFMWVFLSLASNSYALAEERQNRQIAQQHIVALQTQVALLTPTATPCYYAQWSAACGEP